MITSVGLPADCPITAPMAYHARYAVQSKPVVVNRVGNPRAQSAGDHREQHRHCDRSDVLAGSPNAEQAVRRGPGDGNTIDSNVNDAEDDRGRDVRTSGAFQPDEHRDDAECRDDDDQSEQRAEVQAHERSVGAGRRVRRCGAGAGAGGLVGGPFVCVCTRGTR